MRILGYKPAIAVLLAGISFNARAEKALYVNFAPDSSYSSNGSDSRIYLDFDQRLYHYGHEFGKLEPCHDGVRDCMAFDFMALLKLPDDVEVGTVYVVGRFEFTVVARTEFILAGRRWQPYRVDVKTEGRYSNSYLIDQNDGVLAIITPNYDNKSIPRSVSILQGDAGIFAKSPSLR